MPKAKANKKQHFVPRCYKKAWHDPLAPKRPDVTPYVWIFNKDGSNARKKAPSNLFTETDIYTIERPDGGRDLRLERGFQELEDQFTRIRNLCLNRRQMPDEEQMVWLFAFVATAQARTQLSRDHHRQQWGEIRKKMERFQAAFDATPSEHKQRWESPAAISNNEQGAGITLEDIRALEVNPIQMMIQPVVSSVMRAFSRMCVLILCTNDEVSFVTSDHPCTWCDPISYNLPPVYRGVGLGSATIEVTLPISPKQCLLISRNPEFQGYKDIPLTVVNALNNRHIAHCNELFVSCSQNTQESWFEEHPLPADAWENTHKP